MVTLTLWDITGAVVVIGSVLCSLLWPEIDDRPMLLFSIEIQSMVKLRGKKRGVGIEMESNEPRNVSSDIKNLARELADINAAIFVGAGLSLIAVPANDHVTRKFKDWNGFMLQLASKLWEDESVEQHRNRITGDYLYVTQLYMERFGDIEFYKEFLEAVPTDEYLPSKLHLDLLRLPWIEYITTNQDDLIEKALKTANIPFHTIVQDFDLSISSQRRLIKMHGSWEQPQSMVFAEEDYRTYDNKHPLISLKVKQLFSERTVFFIGFGLKDANFKKIYLGVRDILGDFQKKAYTFIPDVDQYTRDYWRKRNLIIISEPIITNDRDEWRQLYQQKMLQLTNNLQEEIKLVHARRNTGDKQEQNYNRLKHLIFDKNDREVMDSWMQHLR